MQIIANDKSEAFNLKTPSSAYAPVRDACEVALFPKGLVGIDRGIHGLLL